MVTRYSIPRDYWVVMPTGNQLFQRVKVRIDYPWNTMDLEILLANERIIRVLKEINNTWIFNVLTRVYSEDKLICIYIKGGTCGNICSGPYVGYLQRKTEKSYFIRHHTI